MGRTAVPEGIMGLSTSLPFQKIQRSIMVQDRQATPDSCTISKAVGQLKASRDPITGCHQVFPLKSISDAWVCTNGMFRRAPHNFG